MKEKLVVIQRKDLLFLRRWAKAGIFNERGMDYPEARPYYARQLRRVETIKAIKV